MAVYVDVAENIYNWALSQIRPNDNNRKAIEQILLWKNGKKKPTVNQIEKVSNQLGLPFGYFFLNTPPKEENPLIEFRTVDSIELDIPSRNLINTIHEMQRIQDWVEEFLIAEEFEKNRLVGLLNSQSNYLNQAELIRKELELPIDWYKNNKTAEDSFRYFKRLLSDYGIIVMMNGEVDNSHYKKLDINEFRAFALINYYAPLIFINSNDSTNAKLFSLLHEFIHICLGENSLYNDNSGQFVGKRQTEAICNAIAAELLVPEKIFIKAWQNSNGKEPEELIIDLAKKFKCGTIVIARRALDKGFIDNTLYKKIVYIAKNNFKKKKTEGGGEFYRTTLSRIDNRFLLMLNSSVIEGKTSFEEAYRLTNTKRNTYDKLIAKLVDKL